MGSTSTGNAGTNASVTMTDNNNVYTLNFVIPKGEKGDTGAKGDAGVKGQDGAKGADGITPTLKVGTVTTLAAGSNANVTMTESNNEYTLNFGIPKGAKGDTGASGSGDSSSVANSEWSGKVASFLGDSITYGANTTKIYHQYLKELVGFSTCNNYGIDGASITNHSNGICTRYNNVSSDSDIIFIFGGTNDFYYNKPLGGWYSLVGTTRTLNKDMTTFRGALAEICDGLITKFPTKQIVLMTPIHRFTFGSQQTDLQANASGLYLDDYVECVKEAGKIFGIPVIDLNGESGLYPMNTENANAYFHANDKLHPNANGHLKMAKVIQGKLRTILPLDISYTPNVYGNIVLSKTSITMNEGTSNTFTVKLDKAPTNSQTVNISSSNSDVTLSPSTLTFNNSNYSTEQTVTINVAEDSDKTNDNCTITLSSSGVTNKTVTLTINDVTVEEPTPDQPSGGTDLTGKSYKLTFNGNKGGYNHIVFVIPKDEDCVSGATLNMKFNINNTVNFPETCSVQMLQIFNSSTPEVNNDVGTVGGSQMVNQTTTFSNGSASIDFNFTLDSPNNNYLKIPYGLKPNSSPSSVDISNIAVTVNGKPKSIVTVGAFFATENCVVSELVSEQPSITYTVTNNLTNVTNDNSTTSVTEGSSYSATLTASSDFTLETVTVSMGGIDITSTVYSNGSISISSVTGNIVINATATKQASSGAGEYRDVTADDVTLINSTLNIDSNGYNLTASNQWDGIRLNNMPTESKITLVQTNIGQCIWYMYKYDDSYMYVLCIGKGNGEHGKVYKLSIPTNSASQIGTIEMSTIPNPGDILKIVVSGTTQTLYCNNAELCTLTDCNTIGISNQRLASTPCVASKWTILE